MAGIQVKSSWKSARIETHVPVFQQTISEIQLTVDTEGQLCEDGSQGGEVLEEMINTRDLQVLEVSDALWK